MTQVPDLPGVSLPQQHVGVERAEEIDTQASFPLEPGRSLQTPAGSFWGV